MQANWMGDNHQGLAIVRVSSRRQKDNISHDMQEREVREYCKESGIEVLEVVRIVESAMDSDNRAKYTEATASAIARGIRHLLFYMYDREARNLTNTEQNEKLVRSGLVVLHYVRERKVLHKESPDSDFFIRDISAVTNKHYSRNLSTKVNDAMRSKAEQGIYPSNHPPLGYATQKLKDERGRVLERRTIIVRDPDERKVRQVQREFELRAEGYSYEQIRQKVLAEGLVSAEREPFYRRASIEKRIMNPFYRGWFRWQGREYEGKHPLLISKKVLEAVREVGRGRRAPEPQASHGVFGGGWIRCALCDCNVVYDPKRKVNRSGEVRTFHYYHCTNGRRMHETQQGMNVVEEEIWRQLDLAVDAISLSEGLAEKIARALNSLDAKARSGCERKRKTAEEALSALETREDRLYADLVGGILDEESFRRQIARVRQERERHHAAIREAQIEMRGGYRENAASILELATNAKSLYLTRSRAERRKFLDLVVSNLRLDGATLDYEIRKPFRTLSEMNEGGSWRALVGNFRTDCAALSEP